ncbi:MAG: hypothetical protein AB8H86_11350 [Polyangiales bacterium]
MNLKNLAIGSLLATSLIFVGCGDDDTTPMVDAGGADVPAVDTGPIDTDAGPPEALPGCDGECFFVVNELNIPSPDPSDGTVIGANLDMEVTAAGDPGGCGVEDYVHPDGTEGVDNALARILPIIEGMLDEPIGDQLSGQISDGGLLITVALTGVDGANDSEVMGILYPDGAIPGDAAPVLEDGRLAPGQTIDIDSEAINIPGAIVDGRFTASLPNFPVEIPLDEDAPLVLNVSQAIFSGDITENGLENGQIAGSLSIEELAAAIGAADVGIDEEGALGILQGFGDLEPNPEGTICARISLGLGYNAVPAIQGDTL